MTEATSPTDIVALAKDNLRKSVSITTKDGAITSVTVLAVEDQFPTTVLVVGRLVGAGRMDRIRVPLPLVASMLSFDGAAFVGVAS